MANITLETVLPDLASMDPPRLERIREQARAVVYSGTDMISELSKEARFNRADAGVILDALNQLERMRAVCPGAGPLNMPAPVIARRSRCAGVLLGP
jgi:hypothetical protein